MRLGKIFKVPHHDLDRIMQPALPAMVVMQIEVDGFCARYCNTRSEFMRHNFQPCGRRSAGKGSEFCCPRVPSQRVGYRANRDRITDGISWNVIRLEDATRIFPLCLSPSAHLD